VRVHRRIGERQGPGVMKAAPERAGGKSATARARDSFATGRKSWAGRGSER